MTDKELLSRTISYLRFPLTVAVVYIHFNISRKGISVHGVNYGLNNPDWYVYLINLISYVIASIAVPLFFFISGYLFFKQNSFNMSIFRQKLNSRIKSLVIPFFLWNLIAIIFQAVRLLPVFSSLFPGAYKTEIKFSIVRLFNTFFNNNLQNGIFVSPVEYTMTETINEAYPIDIPLWYIRDLMVMVVISPLVYWLVKKLRVSYIIIIGAFWCINKVFFPEGGYIVMLSTALFFFSWGSYFGINGINFVVKMGKFSRFIFLYMLLAIADMFTIYTPYNFIIHNIGILIGIVVVISLSANRLANGRIRVNNLLLTSTFFVYALHKLIIDDVAKILFSVSHLPDNTYVMLVFYLMIPIITISLCIGLYYMLNRFIPSVSAILTGGR